MLLSLFISFFAILTITYAYKPDFLEWTSIPARDLPTKTEIIVEDNSSIMWYAATTHQTRVVIKGQNQFNMEFNCQINKLKDQAKYLIEMFFCLSSDVTQENYEELLLTGFMFNFEGNKERCVNVRTEYSEFVKYKTMKDMGDIYLKANLKEGYTVKFSASAKNNVTSYFYCKLWNRFGYLVSNIVHLIDTRKLYDRDARPVIVKSKLYKEEATTFSCKTNIERSFDISNHNIEFLWYSCDRSSRCKRLSYTKKWPIIIRFNGDLHIPYATEDIYNKFFRRKSIQCKFRNITYVTYKWIRREITKVERRDLELLPDATYVDIALFNSSTSMQKLYCPFNIPRHNHTIKWFMRNDKDKYQELFVSNITGNHNITSDYGLTIRGPFMNSNIDYKCEVKAGGMIKFFEYYLTIIIYPVISQRMAREQYGISGRDAVVNCLYNRENYKTNNVTVVYYITSSSIEGAINPDENTKVKNTIYRNRLGHTDKLKFEYGIFESKMAYGKPKQVVYFAYNLALHQDHQVTCLIRQKPGMGEFLSLVFYTVYIKIFDSMLSEFRLRFKNQMSDCIGCKANETHKIACLREKMFVKPYQDNLYISKIYWYLGNELITNSNKHFSLTNTNGTLVIHPISEKSVVDFINSKRILRCVYTMNYPNHMKYPYGNGPIFYSTEGDESITYKFYSVINLTYIPKEEKRFIYKIKENKHVESKSQIGYCNIVITIAIGLLLLIIIVAVTWLATVNEFTRWIRTRMIKGDDDKNERQDARKSAKSETRRCQDTFQNFLFGDSAMMSMDESYTHTSLLVKSKYHNYLPSSSVSYDIFYKCSTDDTEDTSAMTDPFPDK